MDPASIIGIAGSVLGIIEVIAAAVNTLSTLQTKYRNADFTVFLLIGQLSTLKAALNQISEWITNDLDTKTQYQQLTADLTSALEGCRVLILFLDDRVTQLSKKESQNLTTKSKLVFLWDEQVMNDFLSHLNNQINALNLLLTAIQCRSLFEQAALLQDNESRRLINLVKEDTSSMLWLGEIASSYTRNSTITHSSNLLDTIFDFDREIFNSKAYQVALRSNMKQVLSQKQNRGLRNVVSSPIHQEAIGPEEDTDVQTINGNYMGPPLADYDLDPSHVIDSEVGSRASTNHKTTENAGGLQEERVDSLSKTLPPTVHTKVDDQTISKKEAPLKPKKQMWSRFLRSRTTSISRHEPTDNIPLTHTQPNKVCRVLILGTSESGKSTLCKSLLLGYGSRLSDDERTSYKYIILRTAIQSMRIILEAMESLEIGLENDQAESHVMTIFRHSLFGSDQVLGNEIPENHVLRAIEALWADGGVQSCFKLSRECQLPDSAAYYFDHIRRLSSHTDVPSIQDVLRLSDKTTGFTEYTVEMPQAIFKVSDNLAIILFTVDIASYDQVLFEDERVNRMQEALRAFKLVCNSRWFLNTHIWLFFTKIDKLEDKLKFSPLKNYCPDYEGGDSFEAAKEYLANRFLSLANDPMRIIEVHYTSITSDEKSLGNTAMDFMTRKERERFALRKPSVPGQRT
ncbi:guanine nucleotide-binding protein subunit alpha [Xylographa bjoerkii]|nr:guanine nucleotide-binding protein subunit alpha [Xylographa bjoerkii]